MATPFQALSIDDNVVKKNGSSMTSLKDANKSWRMVNLIDGVKVLIFPKTRT